MNKSKKVLITGAGGFCGRYLIKYLKEIYSDNIELFGIDKSKIQFGNLSEIHECDINESPRIIQDVLEKTLPDYIIHFAGLNRSDKSWNYYEANLKTTIYILEALKNLNNRISPKILISSSAAVYGDVSDLELPIKESIQLRPTNQYGLSKVAQEYAAMMYYRKHGVKIVIARTFNIIGPGQSSSFVCGSIVEEVSNFILKRKNRIQVIEVESIRDFIDVRDAVKAYWKLINVSEAGEIYNIGTGEGNSIGNIIKIFGDIVNIELFDYVDIIKPETNQHAYKQISKSIADCRKIMERTGWHQNIKLYNSLSDMLKYKISLC